jgi:hypothetical protein
MRCIAAVRFETRPLGATPHPEAPPRLEEAAEQLSRKPGTIYAMATDLRRCGEIFEVNIGPSIAERIFPNGSERLMCP